MDSGGYRDSPDARLIFPPGRENGGFAGGSSRGSSARYDDDGRGIDSDEHRDGRSPALNLTRRNGKDRADQHLLDLRPREISPPRRSRSRTREGGESSTSWHVGDYRAARTSGRRSDEEMRRVVEHTRQRPVERSRGGVHPMDRFSDGGGPQAGGFQSGSAARGRPRGHGLHAQYLESIDSILSKLLKLNL